MSSNKGLLSRDQNEILEFAKAGRTRDEYAMYLAACLDLGFNEVLKAIMDYQDGKIIQESMMEIIINDARSEFYL